MTGITARLATPEDLETAAALLEEYVRRELGSPWTGSLERLRADGFGRCYEMVLAFAGERDPVGFAAFAPDYDLHVCLRGARLLDLYVRPARRGHGVAAVLLARAAHEALQRDGRYLKGLALPNEATVAFYERCAVPFHGGPEFTLSARAFRHVASLAGEDARSIAASLPPRRWNFVD